MKNSDFADIYMVLELLVKYIPSMHGKATGFAVKS